MSIFHIDGSVLQSIKEKSIDIERYIQNLTEANLSILFGLKLVSSEFSLQNFRIDTLAFDQEAKSFVIIEFKRDRSFSVIDQGFAYLALMLNNKSDFILEYNEKTGGNLKREDVDWTQSKVIFIANSFTTYQQNAINFRDLPLELWEVKIFDNQTILYNQLLSRQSKESIKKISKSETVEDVVKEVKVYTLEDHMNKQNKVINDIFEILREKLFSLGSDVHEVPKKYYIAYKTKTNFVDVEIRSKDIKLFLNVRSGELQDSRNIARDLTKPKPIGHWGNGDYEVVVTSEDNLPYIFGLIDQSYELSKK